jgi:hypothetical protein
MSLTIKFYFTSSMLNMFRTLMLGWGGIRVAGFILLHGYRCGDTIEKSQAPDDGCINVRNMLSIEEEK